MATCYNIQQNQYTYCPSNYGVYIAVGVVLPIVILIISIVISLYVRNKRRRVIREQQQISMTTVVPIYNTDTEQQQAPYNYSYPPNYTSAADGVYDKPPSYEQTIEHLNEINNTSETGPAILPISTITSTSTVQPVQPSQNQN